MDGPKPDQEACGVHAHLLPTSPRIKDSMDTNLLNHPLPLTEFLSHIIVEIPFITYQDMNMVSVSGPMAMSLFMSISLVMN